jgi:hypothetical protein
VCFRWQGDNSAIFQIISAFSSEKLNKNYGRVSPKQIHKV